MTDRLILSLFVMAMPVWLLAGSPEPLSPSTPSERNLTDFDFLVAKMKQNYSGYSDKTIGDEATKLEQLTAQIRTRVAAASDVPCGLGPGPGGGDTEVIGTDCLP